MILFLKKTFNNYFKTFIINRFYKNYNSIQTSKLTAKSLEEFRPIFGSKPNFNFEKSDVKGINGK